MKDSRWPSWLDPNNAAEQAALRIYSKEQEFTVLSSLHYSVFKWVYDNLDRFLGVRTPEPVKLGSGHWTYTRDAEEILITIAMRHYHYVLDNGQGRRSSSRHRVLTIRNDCARIITVTNSVSEIPPTEIYTIENRVTDLIPFHKTWEDLRVKINSDTAAIFRAEEKQLLKRYREEQRMIRAEQRRLLHQYYHFNLKNVRPSRRRREEVRRRSWAMLTGEQRQLIKDIYTESRKLSIQDGIKYNVDHHVPLCGKNVTGLHVPWNLRIVPMVYNIRKKNNFEELSDRDIILLETLTLGL